MALLAADGGTLPRQPRRINVDRHARIVAVLKLLLPLLAVGLLALVWFWPNLVGTESAIVLRQDPGELTGARYAGTDARDRPFQVTAERVVRQTADGEVIHLVRPEARLNEGQGWVRLSASSGEYVPEQQRLELFGGTTLADEVGWNLNTETATVDLGANAAWGDAPVQGGGPRGTVEAQQGFRVEEGGRRILFLGESRLVLNPSGEDAR